jgi:hypothetical protein
LEDYKKMAKQKMSIVGIIVVVGFIAFIMALGGGFFKNFAIQNSGLDVSISPSPAAQVQQGGIITFGYTVTGGSANKSYMITAYIGDIIVYDQLFPFMGFDGDLQITFPTAGNYTFHIVVSSTDGTQSGQSNSVNVCVTSTSINPTPTPTPNPNTSIWQQIQDWCGSIWQAIVAFFKQFGLNLDNAPP